MRSTKTGDTMNNNFADLLNKFDAATTKEQWLSLMEDNNQREPMTARQKSAIHDRCINQINGTYGKSKKPENYNHTKTT